MRYQSNFRITGFLVWLSLSILYPIPAQTGHTASPHQQTSSQQSIPSIDRYVRRQIETTFSDTSPGYSTLTYHIPGNDENAPRDMKRVIQMHKDIIEGIKPHQRSLLNSANKIDILNIKSIGDFHKNVKTSAGVTPHCHIKLPPQQTPPNFPLPEVNKQTVLTNIKRIREHIKPAKLYLENLELNDNGIHSILKNYSSEKRTLLNQQMVKYCAALKITDLHIGLLSDLVSRYPIRKEQQLYLYAYFASRAPNLCSLNHLAHFHTERHKKSRNTQQTCKQDLRQAMAYCFQFASPALHPTLTQKISTETEKGHFFGAHVFACLARVMPTVGAGTPRGGNKACNNYTIADDATACRVFNSILSDINASYTTILDTMRRKGTGNTNSFIEEVADQGNARNAHTPGLLRHARAKHEGTQQSAWAKPLFVLCTKKRPSPVPDAETTRKRERRRKTLSDCISKAEKTLGLKIYISDNETYGEPKDLPLDANVLNEAEQQLAPLFAVISASEFYIENQQRALRILKNRMNKEGWNHDVCTDIVRNLCATQDLPQLLNKMRDIDTAETSYEARDALNEQQAHTTNASTTTAPQGGTSNA